jgi:EPS-associated MarR family transcriptional regulator
MGVSLGKINYCISGFVQEGLVKVETFRKSKKRSRYIYHLTPRGIEEIARLTFRFLEMRIKEYNRIKKEIQQLSDQMNEIDPGLLAGLTEDLEKIKI